jgi:glutaredoxin
MKQRGGNFDASKVLYFLLAFTIMCLIVYAIYKYKKEYFSDYDDATITFYHMEGCGWCKKVKPEWEKCKQDASSKNIKTKEVAAEKMTDADKKKGINGFPTFIITINGKDTKYEGERTSDAIIQYVYQLRSQSKESFRNKKIKNKK